ncbi:MAG TPA: hypothetical protein VNB90_01790 [Cytophagaceae bacterium]|nr:hypothetical protein [Cytophagaceae bacterium]
MKKIFLLPLMVVIIAFSAAGQKITTVTGNLASMKGETKFNLIYNYDNLAVGKYPTEQEYLDYKKGEYAKKDPAKAEEFEAGWKAARAKYYQPKFEELINKHAGRSVLPSNTDAKYTLILKTTFIEPGFNVGVMKQPAYINVEYIFVETANPSNVVAKLTQNKIPGSQYGGYDFDASARIAESYAKAGKMLGGLMAKTLK